MTTLMKLQLVAAGTCFVASILHLFAGNYLVSVLFLLLSSLNLLLKL